MDTNLLQACDLSTTEGSEAFIWNPDVSPWCTRNFETISTYSLPSNPATIINKDINSSTEPSSEDDCCLASEGTNAVLLQACPSATTEVNESLSWNDDLCTRNFDLITTYSLPSDVDTIINTDSTPSSELTTNDACCEASDGDESLLPACDSLDQENESFTWDDGICTRTFDLMINNNPNPRTEPASDDDCCKASDGNLSL